MNARPWPNPPASEPPSSHPPAPGDRQRARPRREPADRAEGPDQGDRQTAAGKGDQRAEGAGNLYPEPGHQYPAPADHGAEGQGDHLAVGAGPQAVVARGDTRQHERPPLIGESHLRHLGARCARFLVLPYLIEADRPPQRPALGTQDDPGDGGLVHLADGRISQVDSNETKLDPSQLSW